MDLRELFDNVRRELAADIAAAYSVVALADPDNALAGDPLRTYDYRTCP